jgi:hypothetical protein
MTVGREVLEDYRSTGLSLSTAVFEENRHPILGATTLGCRGKVRHASVVTHHIVEQVRDLSVDLRRIRDG